MNRDRGSRVSEQGERGAGGRLRAALRRFGAPLLLVLFAFVTVLVHVPQNEQISPIDEFVYSDYLAKIPTEGVVRQGEDTGDYARSLVKCRGVMLYIEPVAAECPVAGDLPDGDFPFGGKTSADIYTPAYFAVTWAVAQPIRWLGVGDLLDAGSYVGFFWLAGALLFLYAASRRMAMPRALALALGLLVAASPAAFWSSTYVSTDAPAMFFGGAILLVTIRLLQGRSGSVVLVVLAVLAVLFKVQNVAVVGFACLALLASGILGMVERRRGLSRAGSAPTAGRTDSTEAAEVTVATATTVSEVRRASPLRFVVLAIVAGVLSILGQAAWIVVRQSISTGPSPDQATGSPLSARALVAEAFKFLGGVPLDPTAAANGAAISFAGMFLWVLTLAGLLALALTARTFGLPWLLAWSAIVISLLLGPLLVLGVSASEGYYFPLPARYGLSLLPAYVLLTGVFLAKRRLVGRFLLALAAPLAVVTLFSS
ncbi:hypothetical protein [Frigoribacterium sp. CFBP 8751]|uniref:hypothetical protein n=1 Tax=Frigoribacterium sp. CFBP 8751 TaxID=2775277 RepID=UPI001784B29B|nr:hypothetical protein [Frigoribacterium sp. CFBP 8751]MBD8538760.1 hypothetical protein [Frigoribacterium sp. CFBP 8751]